MKTMILLLVLLFVVPLFSQETTTIDTIEVKKSIQPLDPLEIEIVNYRHKVLETIGDKSRLGWVVYLAGSDVDNVATITFSWYDKNDVLIATDTVESFIVFSYITMRVVGDKVVSKESADRITSIGVYIFYEKVEDIID